MDQSISVETLNECSNILTNANISTSIISFGCNPLSDTPGVHTYVHVVTDFIGAVKAVMDNYE